MNHRVTRHRRKRIRRRQNLIRLSRLALVGWLIVGVLFLLPALSTAAEAAEKVNSQEKAPAGVLAALATGQPREVIILFGDRQIETEAADLRKQGGLRHDSEAILDFRKERYRQLRTVVDRELLPGEADRLRDYSHLPMSHMRFRSRAALERLLKRPEVVAVYENRPIYPELVQSLPLVKQPQTASLGLTGSGTTVAVIDTGIDYTLPDFGSCSTPGVPAGCRVAASVDVTGNNVTLNTAPGNHGTNVAAIVAGAAPGARIAAINAFTGGSSTYDLIIDGINWAIANKGAYNIVAINMSLGDGVEYHSPCGNVQTNAFVTPVANARSAGILPVASAGNNAYTHGITDPACTPGVVSVGAVYDANVGGLQYGNCTDSTTAADRIACFSNSAGFLTMLAPGALVTAAGITMAGTSQASPHVAGAAAVLRSTFPADTLDQTTGRMTGSGVPITDTRNNVTTPRLNLLAALGAPSNDNYTTAQTLNGMNGQLTANNANASREGGEPYHAGNSGGTSVWWNWTAPASGVAAIDTHGSSFDTLLAVYTGTQVTSLTQAAASDNDGSVGNTSGVTFPATAGTTYMIAVDGSNGAYGAVTLNWNLTLQADLGVTVSAGPDPAQVGASLDYDITVINYGPSTATNVRLTDTLPEGTSLVAASPGCTLLDGLVTCQLGSLTAVAAQGIRITVTPAAPGTIGTTSSVTSDIVDPDGANNTATATTTVNAAPAAVPGLSPWGMAAAALALLAGSMRGVNAGKIGEQQQRQSE
jgi:uncharacterized repeat protein (TIGR01451 family)